MAAACQYPLRLQFTANVHNKITLTDFLKRIILGENTKISAFSRRNTINTAHVYHKHLYQTLALRIIAAGGAANLPSAAPPRKRNCSKRRDGRGGQSRVL